MTANLITVCCAIALVVAPDHVLAHRDNTQNAATSNAQASGCADLWGLSLLKVPVGPVTECIRAGGVEDVNARNTTSGTSGGMPILSGIVLLTVRRPELAEVIYALIDAGADVNATFSDLGLTPLLAATVGLDEPDSDVIDALIRAGADVNHRISDGSTVLHMVARHVKAPFVISKLVAAGADIRARGQSGATPLHEAARIGDSPEMIGALLAAGADLHALGESGETPLHQAVGHNDNRAVIEALVGAGADINARSDLGTTPLHWATSFARTTTGLEALLAADADPNVLDDLNNLPIDYAEENRAIHGTGAYLRLIQARLR